MIIRFLEFWKMGLHKCRMFAAGLFTQYKLSLIPQEPRIVEVEVPYVVEKTVTVEKDVTKDRVKIQKGDTTITNDLKEV